MHNLQKVVQICLFENSHRTPNRTPKKQKNKCKSCPKVFKYTATLKLHEAIHEKKFQCKYCRKVFQTENLLKNHLKFHERPEELTCKIRKRRFESTNNLKRHIKSIHEARNKPKAFKCQMCDLATNSKQNFISHQKTHENSEKKLKSRPNWIKCEKCPALLKSKHIHDRCIETMLDNVLLLACDYCGKTCKRKINVLYHIRKIHKKDSRKL